MTSASKELTATSRRHLRHLALSVSGGALLTVAAWTLADTATAETTTVVEQTGPTTEAGAATPSTPTLPPQPEVGAPPTAPSPTVVVPDDASGVELSSEVTNAGAGTATTGGNTAVGNAATSGTPVSGEPVASGPVAGAGPQPSSGTSSTPSSGSASGDPSSGTTSTGDGSTGNQSTGSASVQTGDASATGNQSDVAVDQEWVGVIAADGSVYLVERSSVVNAGLGVALTGGNTAIGNTSTNVAGGGPGSGGTTDVANVSDGSAVVTTGSAQAIGNDASTTVVQFVGVTQDGSLPVVIEQLSVVIDISVSLADTGGNVALGNVSSNLAGVDLAQLEALVRQLTASLDGGSAGAGSGGLAAVVATSASSATNVSSGSASVTTGAASAVGNQSVTTVRQGWIGSVVGEGVVYIVQQSLVVNLGIAVASTGGNTAIGNTSTNVAGVGAGVGGTVTASNTSDGTAVITTGTAAALGNRSVTTVIQTVTLTSTTGTPVPYVLVQRSVVYQVVLDLAATGDNQAVGNSSTNVVSLPGSPCSTPTVVSGANVSNGTATIVTGAAWAGTLPPPPPPPPPPVVPEQPPVVTPEVQAVEVELVLPPPAAVLPIIATASPAPAVAGTLPYTGGDASTPAILGIVLAAAGAVTERTARILRRRRA